MTGRVRTGVLGVAAMCALCWCSLQWAALLRSIDVRTPVHPWWSPTAQIAGDAGDMPRVQYHEWNVTRTDIAPDGVMRPMILVNGRFPGPAIQANVGDTLVVKVNNQLSADDSSSFAKWNAAARARFSTRVDEYYPRGTDERVAIHWHGLAMRGVPEQDGAPGFTSCAVQPGGSHTYRFQVTHEDVGTHWWHSHSGMARADGLWGTLVVRDPRGRSEETLLATAGLRWDDEQVITLGDHYFAPGIEQLSWFISRHSLGFEPTPDNILINGRGTFDCTRLLRSNHEHFNCTAPPPDAAAAALQQAVIELEPRKTHRLRLVNVGSVGHQTFSIDEHVLTVVEADGVVVEPYVTTRVSIAPGQRYSVLVTADRAGDGGEAGFWLRSEMDSECFNVANPNLDYQARAVVRYKSSTRQRQHELEMRIKRNILRAAGVPKTQAWPRRPGEQACHDEPAHLLRPLRSGGLGAPPTPALDLDNGDRREIITVTMPKLDRNGLVPVSWMNRTQWRTPRTPLLHTLALNTSSIDVANQLVLSPSPSRAVTLELVINNSDEAPHPFHLHGHAFSVLALSESRVGLGAFSASSSRSSDDAVWFGEDEAPVRDTLSVPRRGFAVVRWKADSAGVWAMHCHVLVHMMTGMALAVAERVDELRGLKFVERLQRGEGLCGAS